MNLTQAALAGNKITRNMLSKIENGTALPSLDTLEYIAKNLCVPISFLLTDEDDLIFYRKRELIDKIYRAYEGKSYKACFDLIKTFTETDSELDFIAANACYELAKESVSSGAFITAEKYITLSLKYCNQTRLSTEHIMAKLSMYYAVIKNVQSPLLEFDSRQYTSLIQNSVDFELFKYLTLDFSYPFETPVLSLHMEAKKMIKERNYQKATEMLLNAVELSKKGSYNSFIIFSIYTDLEYCYKQIYDYENAYFYSSKRMTLLENFKT